MKALKIAIHSLLLAVFMTAYMFLAFSLFQKFFYLALLIWVAVIGAIGVFLRHRLWRKTATAISITGISLAIFLVIQVALLRASGFDGDVLNQVVSTSTFWLPTFWLPLALGILGSGHGLPQEESRQATG